METLKFYKGETINILFFARDENGVAIDIFDSEKSVTVFTPGSVPITLEVDDINSSSFRITLSDSQSASLIPGRLFIKLKLSNSYGVQIGRSTFPIILLDSESPNCEGRELQEGADLEMKISLGEKIANINIYMPPSLILNIQ